jgi:hypothetical protein
MNSKIETPLETESSPEHNAHKLFENYIDVDVRESIGTVFLGALSILLLVALLRSRDRYERLLEQIGRA